MSKSSKLGSIQSRSGFAPAFSPCRLPERAFALPNDGTNLPDLRLKTAKIARKFLILAIEGI